MSHIRINYVPVLLYSPAREMGTIAPWEDSVGAPKRPIQVTDGEGDQPTTERDGQEPSDVERDHSGSSQSAAGHPTPVEDKGKCMALLYSGHSYWLEYVHVVYLYV